MKRLTILCAAALCAVGISTASAIILRPKEPAMPKYMLKDSGGKLALFENDEPNPRVKYDIYTQLLPPEDTEALRYGIPVQSPEELRRLLEDLGA
ncbi:MAG: hypothetical protein RSC96_03570 [Oscillospiraceae bacterium]